MQAIRKYLADKGLTQRDFAERLEVSEEMLSRILSGERGLSIVLLNKMARITGVPHEVLAKQAERVPQ